MTGALRTDVVERALRDRTRANRDFFDAEAERLARLCHRMAERFARGGRLIAFGHSPAARSDARHVAVEFVHPVIVGKRALPAIGLAGEGGGLAEQLALLAEPDDIAIAFGAGEDGGDAAAAIALARERGCLTLAFAAAGAEWEFEPPGADAAVRQELVETLYHVLWELVHVFFDHRGLLEGRNARRTHDTGASSFLYPFLGEQEHDLEAIMADVRRSVLAKAQEVGELRAQTLTDNGDELIAAAAAVRADLEAGGSLLALGNGGSATDAMDLVADLRRPPDPRWQPRRALDLTEDAAILTAIANDVGTEAIFARQVIAHGREGDVLVAISTSGNSTNVIAALAEARSRGLRTLALVGYDGGRVAGEGLADHVIVTRSEHIPRIQEAQASAYHVLRELVA
ncbi:MAG: D-sedoheptulose 7-phosphate isomerase [Thermoleophilaceae bacterium]|nr:D-sedoheptulose 7-phosphate isomerase [Thermoleophilaceae bacterium]